MFIMDYTYMLAERPAFSELRCPTPSPHAFSNHVTANTANNDDYQFKFNHETAASQVR